MSTYADRLDDAITRCGNACLVGLDPHLDALPEEFAVARDAAAPRAVRARAIGDFLCQIVDVAAGRIPAVKPQSAFFEVLGADGVAQWERVVAHARAAGLLVIGDVKRGDIDSTAKAYAQAFLEEAPRCDAITINPYLGADAVQPFLDACKRANAGVYVLEGETIERFPEKGDHERTTFPELAAEGRLFAYRHAGIWLTVNTPKDLRVADDHVRANPDWLR